jgi:hypothetical protein
MATRKKKVEVDFADEDSVLEEMARTLDIDPDELEIREDRSGFSVQAYEVTIRGGSRKEWKVVENEDAERELALEIVKQDLDDQPEIFEPNFIESHINIDRLRRDLHSDVQYGNEERLRDERVDDFWDEYEREGFEAPEEDEDGERPEPDDSQIEELAERQTEEQLKDPMAYLEDIYGREDAVKQAIKIAGIDLDAAAEDAVDSDGPAHFLSSYDGQSYTTDGGLVYWRTN